MSKYGDAMDVDAIAIFQESTIETNVDVNGVSHHGIHHMHGEVAFYKDLIRFITQLGRMDAPPVLFCAKNKMGICPLTKEGHDFKLLINQALAVNKHQEFYSLRPKLAYFCSFIVDRDITALLADGWVNEESRSKLTEELKMLMSGLKSPALLKKGYDFMKGPLKNANALRHYVDGLFKRYARLLVIRVDLAYQREFRDTLSLDDILKHKDALLKNRRKGSLAQSWVGYACRLEYAPCTGYHYHLVVFLDGSVYRGDVYHADSILMEWEQITANRGRGFNCNMQSGKYRFCGVGMINHFDKEKRECLSRALAYLTKSDRIAKLKLKKRRTFFKGSLPKKTTNKGRKRIRGNAWTALEDLFPPMKDVSLL